MTLRQSSDPYGYKKLLVYRRAEELQKACAAFTSRFPHFSPSSPLNFKTLSALADQMDRSARSVKQNIVEGWKRNSTKEYYEFLGFSLGANAELEEDCNDIINGVYKGIEWEERGGMGLPEGKGERGWTIGRVEALPFYPLDSHLPLLIQLKLHCKELNMLLGKLQDSLHIKMNEKSQVLGGAWGVGSSSKAGDAVLDAMMEKEGVVRLPNGQIVPKGTKGE